MMSSKINNLALFFNEKTTPDYFIELKGNVPSKKNSKQIIYNNGRPFIISQKAHKDWHTNATKQLNLAKLEVLELNTTKTIVCTFYPPTKRKYDLSNKWESVADLLVDYGFLSDDNFEVVPVVILLHGEKDKENPRVELAVYV